MNTPEDHTVELLGIYNIMGEGLVVELLEDDVPDSPIVEDRYVVPGFGALTYLF